MKKMIFLLLVAVFLTGCLKLEPKEPVEKPEPAVVEKELKFKKAETFKGVFDQVSAIDEKYQINFKKEQLFGPIAQPERIAPALEDLRRLRLVLSPEEKSTDAIIKTKNKNRTELDLGLLFIDARISMLEAERNFHLGYSFGNQGLVGDGFFCVEAPVIKKSLGYFNTSALHALDATFYLDNVLSDNKDITWDHVGVEENKPQFYNTPTQDMFAHVRANAKIIGNYCAGEPEDSNKYITFEGTSFRDIFIHRFLESRTVEVEENA